MAKVKYVVVGFGGIAENHLALCAAAHKSAQSGGKIVSVAD